MASAVLASKNPYADAPRLPEGERIDPRAILGAGGRPVELEIGPGRGGFLVDRLAAHPDLCMLGLEIRKKWAALVDRRLVERFEGRGRVFADDAGPALRRFADGSVRAVFVHFPDPWWKKRHFKRRVVTAGLVADVARVLAPGGLLFLQTDVADRALDFEALFAGEPRLRPRATGDPAVPSARIGENPFGAMSPRERRAVVDGLPIVRLLYERRG